MAERVLGAKHKNNILTVTHYQRCSFCWKESVQKGGFFFLPRAPEAILINFPLKWEITALHCSVVSILMGGEGGG